MKKDNKKEKTPDSGSVKILDDAFKGERFENKLTDHLIKVGQIKVAPKQTKKLTPRGKKALGKYLEKTGQIKKKIVS